MSDQSDTPRTDDAPKTNALIRAEYKTKAARYNAMRHHAREQERELTSARAEADGLEEQRNAWREALLSTRAELKAVTEQRDRLAEALGVTWADIDHLNHWMPTPCRLKSTEALQSLTPTEQ